MQLLDGVLLRNTDEKARLYMTVHNRCIEAAGSQWIVTGDQPNLPEPVHDTPKCDVCGKPFETELSLNE